MWAYFKMIFGLLKMPPKDRKVELDEKSISLIKLYGKGNVALTLGRFTTEEDQSALRKKVLALHFN